MTQAGTRVSVFAQGSMPSRMHFRHHGLLQSVIPLVGVELDTECQTPYDRGLGIGVIIVLALRAISWYRNLEELLSCYVSTVQFDYLLFQRIHRRRLTQLWGNPTQVFSLIDRISHGREAVCKAGAEHALEASKRGSEHSGMETLTFSWVALGSILSISETALNCISEDDLQGSHLIVYVLSLIHI